MSVYRIVTQDSDDDCVDWYGAEIGDLIEVVNPEPYSNVWLKGSKIFHDEWKGYERLCVADSMSDLLKYVEKV